VLVQVVVQLTSILEYKVVVVAEGNLQLAGQVVMAEYLSSVVQVGVVQCLPRQLLLQGQLLPVGAQVVVQLAWVQVVEAPEVVALQVMEKKSLLQ
jgi:hypothetical protein